jgi:GntR family transcriptional regulator, transcriptional repressor for pyruvate dehydrogenase complex
VSRTVIREALNKLKSQGFLQSIAGRGTFVLPYDFSHINSAVERFGLLNTDKEVAVSLLELRSLIELECTERLARNPVIPVCKQLGKTIELMANAIKFSPRRIREFSDLDTRFHLILIKSSGNPIFIKLFEVLRRTISHPFDLQSFPVSTEEIMQKTLLYHTEILECVEARDSEGARSAIRSHLEYATDLYVQTEEL